MLSVVVVGRNDSHGYNLNKRVITSLNSIASMLTLDDELIFVDWNTPITLPVMPVSIFHELTDHCKSVLKVVRVPEKVHALVKGNSTKPLLEPIARNVGIRRSNPDNKWVLSTNTDMIFLTEGLIFRDLFENLDENLWTSYRFELPEFLWESLDGRYPQKTHDQVKRWHSELDLARRYYSNLTGFPNQKIVDAVGDFQLAPRDMWFAIKGFPENMLRGWHVDSRASVAFEKLTRKASSIFHETKLITYHQNHLRTLTGYHAGEGNDPSLALEEYFNSDDWGLFKFDLEKENIDNLLFVTPEILYSELLKFDKSISEYSLSDIEKTKNYELSHVGLYLFDLFATMPKKQSILLITLNPPLIKFISKFSSMLQHDVTVYNFSDDLNTLNYDLVIADFGIEVTSKVDLDSSKLVNFLSRFLHHESRRELTYVFIRAQNWGIRTIIKHFYNVPLFNNYTQTLVGTKKKPIDLSFRAKLKLKLAFSGVLADYAFDLDTGKDLNFQFLRGKYFKLGWSVYKKLPVTLRNLLRRMISRILKI